MRRNKTFIEPLKFAYNKCAYMDTMQDVHNSILIRGDVFKFALVSIKYYNYEAEEQLLLQNYWVKIHFKAVICSVLF